jgi:hypothetical protein
VPPPPAPRTRTPEPSLTPRSFRISKPTTFTQLRESMSTMFSPATPVPSRTGCSPGAAVSVMNPPPALPLAGKTSFSKYGVAFSRTSTVSPATATFSAGWIAAKSPPLAATT